MPFRIRPLSRRESQGDGAYLSADGRWTFLRAENDPSPKRWFAYLDGSEWPANSGDGHTTLREVAEWSARYPYSPKPDGPAS